jgi:hypothetical protein
MTDPTTLKFRRFAKETMSEDTVLVKRVHGYFNSGKFPKKVEAHLINRHVERAPDGWFHPSTHPGWTERMLYAYLTRPEELDSRGWNYEGRLSANLGTMAHELIKEALIDDGALIRPDGEFCGSCGVKRKGRGFTCNEHGFSEMLTMSRGHIDGMLHPRLGLGIGGMDLKTSNNMSMKSMTNGDVEFFRAKWPYYYDQMQEYMRLSGLRFFIVLFLSLGFPWEMKEVRVDYDEVRAFEIEQKYLRVRAAVEAGKVPGDCCRFTPGMKSDECPSATLCRRGFA